MIQAVPSGMKTDMMYLLLSNFHYSVNHAMELWRPLDQLRNQRYNMLIN